MGPATPVGLQADIYKRLLEHMYDASFALNHLALVSKYQSQLKAKGQPEDAVLAKIEPEHEARFTEAFDGLRRTVATAPLVVGEGTKRALDELVNEWGLAQKQELEFHTYADRVRKKLYDTSKQIVSAAIDDLKLGA